MTLHTVKDLKSKNFRRKKGYILAKGYQFKRKSEIKAKKISALKTPIFWGHPNSGSCVQNASLDSFTKYFSVYKILVT